MICPNCREDNAPEFRFCGMCGTALELRRQAGAPTLDPLAAFPPSTPPKAVHVEPQIQPVVAANEARTNDNRSANQPPQHVPSISGPSMLGLDHPSANQPRSSSSNVDSVRDRSFSGLDSLYPPEPRKGGTGRIALLVVLLSALGGSAWWTYTKYLDAGEQRHPQSAASTSNEAPADKPSTAQTSNQDAPPAPDAGPTAAAVAPAGPSEETSAEPKPAEVKPAPPVRATAKKPQPAEKHAAKPERRLAAVIPPPAAEPAAADTGDAAFRKGEAYLYGRGVPENCDEAVKNLKAASAKSNAKARSAFGTMYATGHCVARDLPTSYLWFAQALRVDPNNQILEKDLNAIWNQMTPPERQTATRMKQ